MDQDEDDKSNKINYKEKIEDHQTSIDNLELNFEKIQKESDTLKKLQIECLDYVKECKKETKNALKWRNIFSCSIVAYFFILNIIVITYLDYFEKYHQLLWLMVAHNSILLITPLISYFKSYGERNKNDYYSPVIKEAVAIALRKFGKQNYNP